MKLLATFLFRKENIPDKFYYLFYNFHIPYCKYTKSNMVKAIENLKMMPEKIAMSDVGFADV
jgi:hypothetical protein